MKSFVSRVLTVAATGLTLLSCIAIDNNLGSNYIETSQQFSFYTAELPLDGIRMEFADSLTGFSDSRITIGALRDDTYGITTRSCALTLVPAMDTVDFGTDPRVIRMHFSAAADTTSYIDEASRYILQNVRVYELSEPINIHKGKTNTDIPHGDEIISDGPVVYAGGGDSLSFDFSRSFAERIVRELDWRTDLDTMPHYTAKFPGIYLAIDPPSGNGGRINTFNVSSLTYNSSYYSYLLNGNRVTLKINSEYEGVRKDTTFLFLWGEMQLEDEASYINASTSSKFPQYALNITGHDTKAMTGPATDKIYVEGGGGLKPVIDAEALRSLATGELSRYGDPAKAVITKATLVFPFEMPDEWFALDHQYPVILSPTMQIVSDDDVASFAALADASVSTENQGGINRSLLCYNPDITSHMQQIMNLEDDANLHNYDIWLLVMNKINSENVSTSSAESEAYNQMLYYSYLNSIYGGYGGYGYGGYGYGGYGGYGYGYNSYSNYYSMAMLAAMMSSSSGSSTTVSTILDRDCFYKAILNGPESSSERKPMLKISFAFPKD